MRVQQIEQTIGSVRAQCDRDLQAEASLQAAADAHQRAVDERDQAVRSLAAENAIPGFAGSGALSQAALTRRAACHAWNIMRTRLSGAWRLETPSPALLAVGPVTGSPDLVGSLPCMMHHKDTATRAQPVCMPASFSDAPARTAHGQAQYRHRA